MYEAFYLLHDRFNPETTGWIAWKVNPVLVRSIERWCRQILDLEPIDRELITNRHKIKEHFDRWYLRVQATHGLNRESLVNALANYLLARLQQHPRDPIVRWHWIAFFMHRCVTTIWKIWRLMPQQVRSIDLFEEIVCCSYSKIANLNEVHLVLANFNPGASELVSGINHLKAFIDRRIRYSIFPNLREISGDPNFGRTNLGVVTRSSRGEILKALRCLYAADRVDDEIILWQSFDLYRKQTGRHANQLVVADFAQVGQFYQQRLDRSISFTGAEIKQRLEAIGSAVRTYNLRQPLALDAPISNDEDRHSTWHETSLLVGKDLLKTLESQEILRIVRMEIINFLDEGSQQQHKPSSQQLFWLYYGLDLNQQQIGKIMHLNFGLTNNSGNISRSLSKGRSYLFDRIHTALNNRSPQLTAKEIDAAMGLVLKMYFDRAIDTLLNSISARLNIPPHVQLSNSQQAEIESALHTWIEEKNHLRLPIDLVKTNMMLIIARLWSIGP